MSGGRPLKRKNVADHVDEALRRIEQLERRYDPPLGYYAIKLYADRNALDGTLDDAAIITAAGDGRFLFPIPPDLDQTNLTLAEAGVSVPGANDTEVMIGNCGSDPTTFPGTDMLNAAITINAGDVISWTYGSPVGSTSIDTANDEVQSGDWISINILSGDDTEGLTVILQFFGQAL